MSKVLVKSNGPQVGVNVGSGGPGIAFMVGGEKVMNPSSEEFQDLYGEKGSDSHARAVRMQNLGRLGRYGLAGLSAFNAAYNQTSSGQPGVIGAAGTGAMGGFYGSSGLEDFAARAGQRYGKDLDRYNYFTDFEEVDDPDIADPRGRPALTDRSRLLAEPTANMTTEAPIDQAMTTLKPAREMYAEMGREYGDSGGRRMYDSIGREYGQQ